MSEIRSAIASRGKFAAGAALVAASAKYLSVNAIAAPTKELVIGLNVPLTGPYSDQGADQLRAYRLAIAEINAHGGVMGVQLKESVGDDETKPPTAVANVDRMVDRDGAVMITGGSSTGTAVAVSARCQQKKTIFMATLTHGDETTDSGCHKVTFRRYNNAHMSARAMAKTLLSKYGTGTWFHIVADYSWGWSVRDNIREVVEAKGAKTVKVLLVPLGNTDFSSQLSQAQAAKPDVLVITEFGKDMVNCLNQAAQFGLTKTSKILVPLADEYMAKGTGDNFDGVVTDRTVLLEALLRQEPDGQAVHRRVPGQVRRPAFERRRERIRQHVPVERGGRARGLARRRQSRREARRLQIHRHQGTQRVLADLGSSGDQLVPGDGRAADRAARRRRLRVRQGPRSASGRGYLDPASHLEV